MKRRQMLRGTAGLVLAAGGLVSLSGCASQQIEDYAAEKPALDLARYFNGRVLAYGIFQDRAGRVVRRFNVVMDCSWNGDEGVLDEAFTYSDGSTERRLRAAAEELPLYKEYDYTVINDDLERTVEHLKAVVHAARCRTRLVEPEADRILGTFPPGR